MSDFLGFRMRSGLDFVIWHAKIGPILITYTAMRALFGRFEFPLEGVFGGLIIAAIFRFLDVMSTGFSECLDIAPIVGLLERKGFRGVSGAKPETYRSMTQDWFSDQNACVTLEAKGEGLRVTGPCALLRKRYIVSDPAAYEGVQ
jgi:hypothetical protein